MRFILRRLGFYAIALWGAITLNFLLPRLSAVSPFRGCGAAGGPRPTAFGGNYEMGLFCATPPLQMRVSVTALSG
jgi:hypothetical protein